MRSLVLLVLPLAACLDAPPSDDVAETFDDQALTGSGSGSGTCKYKKWSVPWSCTYACLPVVIGGSAFSETQSGTLSGTASCDGGSCAAAAAAAESSFHCPSSYPKLDAAGIWYATCRLTSGPTFGGVSCQIVY
jgi:hypothetical protein